jgi:MFS family permease
MNAKLLMTLTCMSFLWIGSQIPLYLFGSVLPLIYQDIGGVDRYTWFVVGYLIPNAALCPFVGALSDLFGRQKVAIVGQVALIIGPIITATASTMNIAIGEWSCLCHEGQKLTITSWQRLFGHWCRP